MAILIEPQRKRSMTLTPLSFTFDWNKKRLGALLAGSVCWASVVTPVSAGELMVAVAANFQRPMQAIAASFERESGHALILSFGATGSFYAQIKNGAPYQVLLSADQDTPSKLVAEGLGVERTQLTYAVGQLVLWSAKAGYVDAQGQILKTQPFQRLAIANPKLAPYGLAAIETLKKLDLLGALERKMILGDNIAQTHQWVMSENAELGFVALSQVMTEGKISTGSAWMVPPSLHAPIAQDAVVLKNGKGNALANALMIYLQSDKIKSLIRSYGYRV